LKKPPKPAISARKPPRQARSTQLVADIMEAATRVLMREGARRFTTARVADEAGISIGSLYQYFPNKESILFKLQTDEWNQTRDFLGGILADVKIPPFDRVRQALRLFFKSECEEALLRVALADAAPLYRHAPETLKHRSAAQTQALAFIAEVLPRADQAQREFCADLLTTIMSAVGKNVSEQGRSMENVDAFAVALGDMFCGYLASCAGSTAKPKRPSNQ
jgi:AcrR family transcriptional regulator